MAAVKDDGEVIDPARIDCQNTAAILEAVEGLKPFRAVIEASGTYRWLYGLLSLHGTVLLAHPLRLRAMIQRRSKTDKLDAQLLANLLRIDQIPLAYVPPKHYQQLRDLTRCRVRMTRGQTEAKIQLRALLARQNRSAPYKTPFGPRGLAWFRKQDFGPLESFLPSSPSAVITEEAVVFPIVGTEGCYAHASGGERPGSGSWRGLASAPKS